MGGWNKLSDSEKAARGTLRPCRVAPVGAPAVAAPEERSAAQHILDEARAVLLTNLGFERLALRVVDLSDDELGELMYLRGPDPAAFSAVAALRELAWLESTLRGWVAATREEREGWLFAFFWRNVRSFSDPGRFNHGFAERGLIVAGIMRKRAKAAGWSEEEDTDYD